MTKHRKLAVTATTAAMVIAALFFLYPKTASKTVEAPTPPIVHKPSLTHRQEVWLNVLEWCESRADPKAINPEDRDHTPSYGAFQFKPSTLDHFAALYGIATTTLMDYDTQRAVVTQMILHRDDINWFQQFPECVKKNGLPPKTE